MEDPEKKLNQKSDGKPRKVRFKISSSYSGRVLKQVFEDGQELESPKEEYPHSFLQESLEPMDSVYGSGEAPKPRPFSPKLTAQRISVFREGSAYTLAGSQPFFNDFKTNDHKVGIGCGVEAIRTRVHLEKHLNVLNLYYTCVTCTSQGFRGTKWEVALRIIFLGKQSHACGLVIGKCNKHDSIQIPPGVRKRIALGLWLGCLSE